MSDSAWGAFARGLQEIAPVGIGFADDMAKQSAQELAKKRIAYIEDAGKMAELSARAKASGTDLEEMKVRNPSAFNSIVTASGIDPRVAHAKDFNDYASMASSHSREAQSLDPSVAGGPVANAYLKEAMSFPSTDESMVAGDIARIRAAQAFGMDTKPYLEMAAYTRGVTKDRAERSEKAKSNVLEALGKISGFEDARTRQNLGFNHENDLEGVKHKNRLGEIGARGAEERKNIDKKAASEWKMFNAASGNALKEIGQIKAQRRDVEAALSKFPRGSDKYIAKAKELGVPLKAKDGTPFDPDKWFSGIRQGDPIADFQAWEDERTKNARQNLGMASDYFYQEGNSQFKDNPNARRAPYSGSRSAESDTSTGTWN